MQYLDNLLIWTGYSCLYKPKDHNVSEVRRVRVLFKEIILGFSTAHGICLLISVIMIVRLNGLYNQSFDGVSLNIGFWLLVAAIVFDIIFIALFFVFDQITFFSLPSGMKFDPVLQS
jgi:hypothetical protein